MVLFRGRRPGPDRFASARVGLFFAASGVWVAGLVSQRGWLTWVAIGLLVVGLGLGLLGRRQGDEPDE